MYDVIGHLLYPNEIIPEISACLKRKGKLKVTIDNFTNSNNNDIHRNKEVNFHVIFKKNSLKRVNNYHFNYIKL